MDRDGGSRDDTGPNHQQRGTSRARQPCTSILGITSMPKATFPWQAFPLLQNEAYTGRSMLRTRQSSGSQLIGPRIKTRAD